jgi:hypothetical protein
MRMDYSNQNKNTYERFNVKNILGIAILLFSTGMRCTILCRECNQVGNLQSDVGTSATGMG